mmetsp:Transcript_14278/g.23632  ORF Transcript_14278/g.23632 Transcript_14278/m.23632 type:complete len:224 (-) Transcript_14278:10-681(-)
MNATARSTRDRLTENSLVLALGSVVAGEALADSRGVVASSTSGTVASLSITVTLQHIRAGRALHKGAVRTAAAKIANASHVLVGIPRGRVCAGSLGGELLLGEADTGIGASVGADGSLASDTLIVGEACALSGGAVTVTLVGALHNGVQVVGRLHVSYPGHRLGAGALGAVSSSPGGLTVLAVVAGALVVDPAGSVSAAPVGAVGDSHSGESSEQKSTEHDSL